ncbi:hypothetical protein [Curtobacterium sp. 24E2]|nr:hypothetical protein JN350_12045 [Curtobacterium sp. 24E2]
MVWVAGPVGWSVAAAAAADGAPAGAAGAGVVFVFVLVLVLVLRTVSAPDGVPGLGTSDAGDGAGASAGTAAVVPGAGAAADAADTVVLADGTVVAGSGSAAPSQRQLRGCRRGRQQASSARSSSA